MKRIFRIFVCLLIAMSFLFYEDILTNYNGEIYFQSEKIEKRAERYFTSAQNFADTIGGEYYFVDDRVQIVYGYETLEFGRDDYWTNVVNKAGSDTFIASYYKDGQYFIDIEEAMRYLNIVDYSMDLSDDFEKTSEIQKVPVLLYHHVVMINKKTKADENNYSVMMNVDFEEQIKYLYESGYNTITFKQLYQHLYEGRKLPDKPILITFDDGYYSNYRVGYPILKKYGFTASEFLIVDKVKERYYDVDYDYPTSKLSWDHVKKMADVFEFHSHTNNMHILDSNNRGFLVSKGVQEVEDDVLAALNGLQRNNVDRFRVFAYPYGQYNESLIDILKLYDYKMAVTVENGLAHKDQSPYEIKRVIIIPGMGINEFKAKVSGE